jgi:hypothetical protein
MNGRSHRDEGNGPAPPSNACRQGRQIQINIVLMIIQKRKLPGHYANRGSSLTFFTLWGLHDDDLGVF